MAKILGRQDEIISLKEILYSVPPQFLAIYGRRRVGKAYLIRNYFAEKEAVIFFDATGLKNASMSDQLANFTDRVGEIFYNGAKLLPDKNWRNMFKTLTDAFKTVEQDKKIVIFLDEFPRMATNKSGLLQSLDYFWNQYWSKDNRIKLIICGSSASWILDRIINNKGELHNRITASILLEPFKLKDTKQFLKVQGLNITNQRLVELYMITGGIPYYLSKFKNGLSVAQNIEQIAFRRNAFLLNEFDNLFSSLFDQSDVYVDIVRYIARNKSGVSQTEIFKHVKDISTGGQATKKLRTLEDTGFIKSFTPYAHNKKGMHYRVIDEFTLFYLKWIEPIKQTLFSTGVANHYWENQMQTQDWAIWSGYAFESLCYKHLLQISNSLRIKPTSVPNAWRYVPKKNVEDKGAQIDLLFDRPDNAITLCEIKYSNRPFTIDKNYADTLRRKIIVFQKQTKTKKQIFFSLIAANGVTNNYYTESIINEIVTLDDLIT